MKIKIIPKRNLCDLNNHFFPFPKGPHRSYEQNVDGTSQSSYINLVSMVEHIRWVVHTITLMPATFSLIKEEYCFLYFILLLYFNQTHTTFTITGVTVQWLSLNNLTLLRWKTVKYLCFHHNRHKKPMFKRKNLHGALTGRRSALSLENK